MSNIDWFREARFGLFIHWGLYAATEGYWNGKETQGIGEWIVSREKIPMEEYEKFTDKMTCENFDPAMWAKLAKNAGMQYCVFTSKHHEGYAMFDTSYDDYSIVRKSPYGKDVARQVTDAMRAEGIVPCFYYSHALDFHEPNARGNNWDFEVPYSERDFQSYIDGKCKHQLKEILTNYGPIGMVWMDVPQGITEELALDIKSYVKSLQPECLVSGRIHYESRFGDFGCFGDNQIPAGKPKKVWETAATMNGTWGYKRDDHNFKSVKEILELLCGCLSKGVNLLLNIGPKPDGSLPQESITILEELGKWYQINGEAVNGTLASPFPGEFSFGAASCKNNAVYLYFYDEKEDINIYGLENQVKSVRVLGGRELAFIQDNGLHFELCKEDFGSYVTVVKLELDGEPVVNGVSAAKEALAEKEAVAAKEALAEKEAPAEKEVLFQQEKDYMTLTAAYCKINKTEEVAVKVALEGDSAIEAENMNLAEDEQMAISAAGIVNRWFSEKNCLSWEFAMEQAGEYDVYLYTLTRKYKEWLGGHMVHVECGALEDKAAEAVGSAARNIATDALGSAAGEAASAAVSSVADKRAAMSITESKVTIADRKDRSANGKYFGETGSYLGSVSLHQGANSLTLIADQINKEEVVGLSVSKIVLAKKS